MPTFGLKVSSPGLTSIIPVAGDLVKIGSLRSNEVALSEGEAEPIHMVLVVADERLRLTTMGAGVTVNGKESEVDVFLNVGDQVNLGRTSIKIVEMPESTPASTNDNVTSLAINTGEGQASPDSEDGRTDPSVSLQTEQRSKFPFRERRRRNLLFDPRKSIPFGWQMEVVAYWGNKVLEVDHFRPGVKGRDRVIIGYGRGVNFPALGMGPILKHLLVVFIEPDKYRLCLREGMSARVRSRSKVVTLGAGKYLLGAKDVVNVSCGPVNYFIIFRLPPKVNLPRQPIRDPFFVSMSLLATVLYCLLMAFVLTSEPPAEDHIKKNDEAWAVVTELPKPEPLEIKPPPEIELVKKPVEVAREKSPPATPKNPASSRPPKTLPPARKPSPAPVPRPMPRPTPKVTSTNTDRQVATKVKSVNLSALGIGAGKTSSFSSAGAIPSGFTSQAGGMDQPTGNVSQFSLSDVGPVGAVEVSTSSNLTADFGSSSGMLADKGGAVFNRKGGSQVALSDEPLAGGGLSQAEISQVIAGYFNQIRLCYERLLQSLPGVSGKVKVRFIIGAMGRVSQTSIVSSSISDPGMTDCMKSKIKKWSFPKPRGAKPVTVNYPFNFDPL